MPTIVPRALLQVFQDIEAQEPHVSTNPGPHAFASEALQCSRKIGMRLLGHDGERSEDLHFLMAGAIGRVIHTHLQKAMAMAYPGFIREVKWRTASGRRSGRVDGVYPRPDLDNAKGVWELKTVGPWAFKRAVSEGEPSEDHLMQGSLGAMALGADYVHVMYVDRACEDENAPLLDWVFPVNRVFTQMEAQRQDQIVDMVRAGTIPGAWFQGQLIDDPASMKWP